MKSFDHILEILKTEKFVVFGAGGHGKKFVESLKMWGVSENFAGYATTKGTLDGSVKCIDAVPRSSQVVIAVHSATVDSVINYLVELGFSKYISIDRFLIEFCCGKPYDINGFVDINHFVEGSVKSNYLAALYAVVDCTVKKDVAGEEIYKKLIGVHGNKDTANKRWDSYLTRIQACLNGEYKPYPIKINPTEKYILDGNHRIALARYFGLKEIAAQYFDCSFERYSSIFEQSCWNDEKLSNYFSEKEIQLIMNAKGLLWKPL